MDEATKKRLKQEVRERERQAALRALPLPIAELEALFEALNVELPRERFPMARRTRRLLRL